MTSTQIKLTNKQKVSLADEVMQVVAEYLTRDETIYNEDLTELHETREGQEAMLVQAATWFNKLPGDNWNSDLPKPWMKNNGRTGYWVGNEWFKHED